MKPINYNNTKIINILPVYDIKEHSIDINCKCNPKIVEKDDRIIIIHQDYDLKRSLLLKFHNLTLTFGQLN